jgi:hypothetical protein
MVIGAARTGSTLLMQLLETSPDTKVYYELFHRKELRIDGQDCSDQIPERDREPFQWLDGVLESSGRPVPGFKIFSNQNEDILDAYIKDGSVAKIVIFRENFLAGYSSLMISAKKARWGEPGESVSLTEASAKDHSWTEQVAFDRDDFEKRYAQYLSFFKDAIGRLNAANQPFLFIEYAELLNEGLVRRLFPFIGARQPDAISVNLKKNNTSFIVNRFTNADEVRAYLSEIGKWDWVRQSFFVWN